MARKDTTSHGDEQPSRQPPIHIPLDFETAVGGLLAVDPKQPVESVRKPASAKKKPANKK